jgi:hypothetical protein
MHTSLKSLRLQSYCRRSGPPGPAFGRPEDRLRAAKSRNPESWLDSWVPAFRGNDDQGLKAEICAYRRSPRGRGTVHPAGWHARSP